MIQDITPKQKAKFFTYLKEMPNGCVEWQGTRGHKGHGRYRVGASSNSQSVASRVAFFLAYGWLPLVVRHSCDNPPCCNPDHLLAGDYADNTKDMMERKRGNPGKKIGSTNHNSVLTEEFVREIRMMLPNHTNRAIAERFGVTPANVSLIRCGKAWVHVK